MNLQRDFDVKMARRADDLAGLEYRWHLSDFAFLEGPAKQPFFAKVRQGFRALTQISKIRIQITLEMREPVLK